jgi:hypothetical protein
MFIKAVSIGLVMAGGKGSRVRSASRLWMFPANVAVQKSASFSRQVRIADF